MSKLQNFHARAVAWRRAASALTPFEASVDGQIWQVRINDFPAEPMYTLIVADREIDHFDDWPAAWKKPA
ncbi:MAG: hypothetical protein KF778_22010 [Rhodocyclaceae bacterium]|nr:hypothetical protein [Rhodocyclaceae bacterium]MBX3671080.1 hypothetical protein [Rhodocyclaceae bacterium]